MPQERPTAPSPLVERLGFDPTSRVLIVNADDVGMSHAANQAAFDGLARGLITSASAMVVGPWFAEVAAHAATHPALDLGVHLTHTSEMAGCRWRGLAGAGETPGLVDAGGFLWPRAEQVWAHATPVEVEREGQRQIEAALAAGLDVTHLDSHMGVLNLDAACHTAYVRLALAFDLPVRAASAAQLAPLGLGALRTALDDAGLVYPDYCVYADRHAPEPPDVYWTRMLGALPPGVTEIAIHPALPSDEMRAMTQRTSPPFAWAARAEEHRLFTDDPAIRALLDAAGVHRIGWRVLRALQRRARSAE